MHRLVNMLLSGAAALAVGAGAVCAEAPKTSKVIGISPCDNETAECKDRRASENGAAVVFAFSRRVRRVAIVRRAVLGRALCQKGAGRSLGGLAFVRGAG
jgi:hypothetical protein